FAAPVAPYLETAALAEASLVWPTARYSEIIPAYRGAIGRRPHPPALFRRRLVPSSPCRVTLDKSGAHAEDRPSRPGSRVGESQSGHTRLIKQLERLITKRGAVTARLRSAPPNPTRAPSKPPPIPRPSPASPNPDTT